MERLTRYICYRAHGAEGTSSERLTGAYCRGQFETTALVERLAAIEDILGDDYDLDRLSVLVNQRMTMREDVAARMQLVGSIPLDRLRELLNACKGLEPGEIEESKLLIATRKDTEKLRRMAELVEADRDGRCVVLPVKPGTVWVANKWSHEPVEVYYPSATGIISDMERGCVFGNTKEEAQVALDDLKGE